MFREGAERSPTPHTTLDTEPSPSPPTNATRGSAYKEVADGTFVGGH